MNQNIYHNTHHQSQENTSQQQGTNFHPLHYLPHQPHHLLQQFSKESSLTSSTPPPCISGPSHVFNSCLSGVSGGSGGQYCALGAACPFGVSPHVHAAHGVLTRSKSLDDLISLSNPSSEESCSSCEFHCGPSRSPVTIPAVASNSRPFIGNRAFPATVTSSTDSNTLPIHFNEPPHIALAALGLSGITGETIASDSSGVNSLQAPIPGHHHSHHQLGHGGSYLPPCDTMIYDSMLQRMGQLKMN